MRNTLYIVLVSFNNCINIIFLFFAGTDCFEVAVDLCKYRTFFKLFKKNVIYIIA